MRNNGSGEVEDCLKAVVKTGVKTGLNTGMKAGE